MNPGVIELILDLQPRGRKAGANQLNEILPLEIVKLQNLFVRKRAAFRHQRIKTRPAHLVKLDRSICM